MPTAQERIKKYKLKFEPKTMIIRHKKMVYHSQDSYINITQSQSAMDYFRQLGLEYLALNLAERLRFHTLTREIERIPREQQKILWDAWKLKPEAFETFVNWQRYAKETRATIGKLFSSGSMNMVRSPMIKVILNV